MPTFREHLDGIQASVDEAWRRCHDACAESDAKNRKIAEMQDRLREVELVLGSIVEWAEEPVKELRPDHPDPQGDVIRKLKEQVRRLLGR